MNTPNDCLALSAKMCKSCSLKIFVYGRTVQIEPRNGQWKEYKFLNLNNTTISDGLEIETCGGSAYRFWSIGNLRSCSEDEHRVLKVGENKVRCVETNWQNNHSYFEPDVLSHCLITKAFEEESEEILTKPVNKEVPFTTPDVNENVPIQQSNLTIIFGTVVVAAFVILILTLLMITLLCCKNSKY